MFNKSGEFNTFFTLRNLDSLVIIINRNMVIIYSDIATSIHSSIHLDSCIFARNNYLFHLSKTPRLFLYNSLVSYSNSKKLHTSWILFEVDSPLLSQTVKLLDTFFYLCNRFVAILPKIRLTIE